MIDSVETVKRSGWTRAIRLITQAKTSAPSLIIMYILMVIFFALMSKNYLTLTNFTSIMSNLTVLGIAAVGMTVVILSGGIDLSIGSMQGFTGVILALLFNIPFRLPIPIIILIGMIVGSLIGAINGFFVTKVRINPVITTLGTMSIFRGLCYIFATKYVGRIFDPTYLAMNRLYIFNALPISFIYMLAFMGIMAIVLKFTKFGRNVYAVGGNLLAARLAGINTDRVRFMAYVISGLFSALSAVVLTGQLGMGRPEFGTGNELEVITAVVLGGISLAGGRGDFLGVLIAVLILGSIGNGMVLLNVPIYWRQVVKGFILIIAVSIDVIRYRRSRS